MCFFILILQCLHIKNKNKKKKIIQKAQFELKQKIYEKKIKIKLKHFYHLWELLQIFHKWKWIFYKRHF